MYSPKDSDYQIAGAAKVIKKSIVPIIRIVVKNSVGEKELKGTLRISHMIPVPESELELYDLEHEEDDTYKDLVRNEMIFIRKNRDKIYSNAKLLYKQKAVNDTTAGYVKSALDYQALEKLCVCNVFTALHSKNPVKSSLPSYLNVNHTFRNVQFQKIFHLLSTFGLVFFYVFYYKIMVYFVIGKMLDTIVCEKQIDWRGKNGGSDKRIL